MHGPSEETGSDSLRSVQLMARVARGQRGAPLELFRSVAPGMHRTLHRLVGGGAPLEPLLEAALVRAVRRAHEYTGAEPLALWAECIAVQVATSYLVGAAPSPECANADTSASPAAPALKVADLLSRVHAILRKMRPEEQVAFALLELDGRSLREASSLLGASPSVVRQRASRARRQLLFAARSDRLIAGYVRLADSLRRIAGRLNRLRSAPPRDSSLDRVQGRVVKMLALDAVRP
jgi:RNA polymerase sigma factor (sigma-70 family)